VPGHFIDYFYVFLISYCAATRLLIIFVHHLHKEAQMNKRGFCETAVGAAMLAVFPIRANAAGPLLWLFRIVIGSLERQAVVGGVRLVGGAVVRNSGRNVIRSSASAGVAALRAQRAAKLLKTLSAFTLTTIATDEVLAQVQGTPEDSIARWVLAYFAVLTQSDADAAMGMWIDPPHENNFAHFNSGQSRFRVQQITQETRDQVRVRVLGRYADKPVEEYLIRLSWTQTDVGPRISDLESIAS
jgi:hypothetical protein